MKRIPRENYSFELVFVHFFGTFRSDSVITWRKVYSHKHAFSRSSTKKKVQRCKIARSRWPINTAKTRYYAAVKLFSRNEALFARVACVACGIILLKPQIVQVVFGYYTTIAPRNGSERLTVFVFKKVRSNLNSEPKSTPESRFFYGLPTLIWGFSESQMQRFGLFTYRNFYSKYRRPQLVGLNALMFFFVNVF